MWRLAVNPVNDAPVAADDVATIDEDAPVTIAVLANDSDVDGEFADADQRSGPANGTATINADGTVTYSPALNFNGADGFSYITSGDGNGGAATANVTITVNPVNDAPVAADDAATTDEDTLLRTSLPQASWRNADDVDGDALAAILNTSPSNGTLTLNSNGSFSYIPDLLNFNGSDSFTYNANDEQADSNVATVSITVNAVNDAPVADAGGPYAGNEGAAIGLDGNGSSDVDGDSLTYAWSVNSTACSFDDPTSVTPQLTCTDNGDFTVTLTVTDPSGALDSAPGPSVGLERCSDDHR